MDDKLVKLAVFEQALCEAYKQVQEEEQVIWCSLHKVMKKVGLPLDLFTERLQQLWNRQFDSSPGFVGKYSFGLEVDATPTEYYRYRNKQIVIDQCARYIINMGPKKW